MPPAVAQEVLQIGSEALLNAYRHARASLIKIRFERSGEFAVLRIRDDGIGIGEETRVLGAVPGLWGLPGMRERARRIGATLTVDSPASGGTLVELRLPEDVLGRG